MPRPGAASGLGQGAERRQLDGTRSLGALLGVVLATSALGGCGHGQPSSGSSPTGPPLTQPSTSPSGKPSAEPTTVGHAETSRVRFKLKGDRPSWLTLVPGRRETAYASGQPGEVGAVWIYNERERSTQQVASLPRGGITWLSSSGRYLVWGQLGSEQNDPSEPVGWQILSYNLITKTTETIAQGKDADPPVPKVFGATVIWPQFLGFTVKANDVWAENLRTGRRELVFHKIRAGQIAGNGRDYVINVTERLNAATHTYRTDLFRFTLAKPRLVRVTSAGNSDNPTLAGNTLVWRAGLHGAIVASRLNGPSDVVTIGSGSQGFQTAGPGYAADLVSQPHGGSAIRVTPISAPDVPTYLTGPPNSDICIGCGVSARGHRLAWGYTGVSATGRYEASTAVISDLRIS